MVAGLQSNHFVPLSDRKVVTHYAITFTYRVVARDGDGAIQPK